VQQQVISIFYLYDISVHSNRILLVAAPNNKVFLLLITCIKNIDISKNYKKEFIWLYDFSIFLSEYGVWGYFSCNVKWAPNILVKVVPMWTMLTVVPFHHTAVFCAVAQREVFVIWRYAFELLTFSLQATAYKW